MNQNIIFWILVLATAWCTASEDRQAVLKEFDAYLEETASQLGDSPFAAVISKNGEILYERYYDGNGVLGLPVNENSRWQVFSITKSFVSGLVLRLCQEEVLSLEDPVSKYLPDFNAHGGGAYERRDVRLRHLLSHTSGAAIDGDKTPSSLPSDFDKIEIISKPGTDFEYSGLGMFILERMIESATGSDFDSLLNEKIIEPLGLISTGYVYSEGSSDQVMPLKKDQFYFSQSGSRAGSGLFTTARDLNKFGQFWLNPESMFSLELREEVWTYHGMRGSDKGRYGLLWWLFESDGGFVMSGKDNKINAVIPETNVVVTVIRYPQAKSSKDYNFSMDKRTMVLFGNRL